LTHEQALCALNCWVELQAVRLVRLQQKSKVKICTIDARYKLMIIAGNLSHRLYVSDSEVLGDRCTLLVCELPA
jgi:hypothetical protein